MVWCYHCPVLLLVCQITLLNVHHWVDAAISRSCALDEACQTPPDRSGMAPLKKLITAERTHCQQTQQCPEYSTTQARAYSPCYNGQAADEYDCKGVDMLSHVPLAELGCAGEGNDLWGWVYNETLSGQPVKPARQYGLVGCEDGLAFVDVTQGTNPVVLGFLPTRTVRTIWRDVKTFRNWAYIVADGAGAHGMQLFNLSRLTVHAVAAAAATKRAQRSSPYHVHASMTWSEKQAMAFQIASAVPHLVEDGVYSEFGSAHNLVINEMSGYAYAVGSDTCSGGLHMINLRTPNAPQFVGCFGGDGYTHDASCVIYHGPDSTFAGREVCLAFNEDTLTVVDVTNKNNPTLLSRTAYNAAYYTHQGWWTEDHAYIIMNDELDEWYEANKHTRSLIWSMSSLLQPVHLADFRSSELSIDHNLYVYNKSVYQANYCAGLRILDASNVSAGLTERAFFDVSPLCNSVQFKGSWSVYPYFGDKVLVQSIERGLFVLRETFSAPSRTTGVPSRVVECTATMAVASGLAVSCEVSLLLESYFNGSWIIPLNVSSFRPVAQYTGAATGTGVFSYDLSATDNTVACRYVSSDAGCLTGNPCVHVVTYEICGTSPLHASTCLLGFLNFTVSSTFRAVSERVSKYLMYGFVAGAATILIIATCTVFKVQRGIRTRVVPKSHVHVK